MNNLHLPDTQANQEARYALRVTARLSESAEALPSDITQRLRVARQQALQLAAQARAAAKPAVTPVSVWAWSTAGGPAGSGESFWLHRVAAFLPLIALIAGLLGIQELHSSHLIAEAAEIDAALLADDLPPDAYQDVGFLEFLKRPPSTE
jgi:Protein of unknown function (DUF3619)